MGCSMKIAEKGGGRMWVIYALLSAVFAALTSILAKIGIIFMMPTLWKIKKIMDPRIYNGAMFVGLNGLSVKSHGGTDALGFSVAVNNAANLVRQNFVSTIKSEVEKVDLDELSQEVFYDMY